MYARDGASVGCYGKLTRKRKKQMMTALSFPHPFHCFSPPNYRPPSSAVAVARTANIIIIYILSIILYHASPTASTATSLASAMTPPPPPPPILEYAESLPALQGLGLKEWKKVQPPALVDGVVHLIDGNGNDTLIDASKYSPRPYFVSLSDGILAFMSESGDDGSPSMLEGSVYNENGTKTTFEVDGSGEVATSLQPADEFIGDGLYPNGTSYPEPEHLHDHKHSVRHLFEKPRHLFEKQFPSLASVDVGARGFAEEREQGRRSVLSLFEDCYTNSDKKHRMDIGMAVTYHAYKDFFGESVEAVEAWLAESLSKVNHMYVSQLNVELHIINLVIMTSSSRPPEWNVKDRDDCLPSAHESLLAFRKWIGTDSPAPAVALWNLLDLCYLSDGKTYLGLAYTGKACASGEYKVALTRIRGGNNNWPYNGQDTWEVMAHEWGHSFDMGHHGMGGIMDPGDPIPPGETEPGINEQYRKGEVCGVSKLKVLIIIMIGLSAFSLCYTPPPAAKSNSLQLTLFPSAHSK